MYKVFNGKNWLNFETYLLLINWLSQYNASCFSNKTGRTNTFLEKVGNSDKDTYRDVERIRTTRYFVLDGHTYSYYDTKISYKIRNYRVVNEDDISIYSSKLVKDVLNHNFDRQLNEQWIINRNKNKKFSFYRSGWLMIKDSDYPEFRRGPIPFIHKYSGYRCYRRIHTYQEKKLTCNPESEPFNRGSRAYNLPTSWDDIGRDWRNSGWKSQGKRRHQWENGVIEKTKHKHGKHTYVCKNNKNCIDSDWFDADIIDEENNGISTEN